MNKLRACLSFIGHTVLSHIFFFQRLTICSLTQFFIYSTSKYVFVFYLTKLTRSNCLVIVLILFTILVGVGPFKVVLLVGVGIGIIYITYLVTTIFKKIK
jgi:hypothetical protein